MNKEVYREFNKGWNSSFDELLTKLEPFNVEVSQAKEKYAELRVYVYPDVEEAEAIIEEYAEKSKTICELCGSSGKVENIGGRIVRTLCAYCYKNHDKIARGEINIEAL